MPSREIEDFIARWSAPSPSERASAQLFLVELCDLLGVPRPDPKPGSGYAFEFPVTEHHPDGSTSEGRIDLYKRAAFLLEAKQFQDQPPTPSDLHLALESAGAVSRKRKFAPVRGTGQHEAFFPAAGSRPDWRLTSDCHQKDTLLLSGGRRRKITLKTMTLHLAVLPASPWRTGAAPTNANP